MLVNDRQEGHTMKLEDWKKIHNYCMNKPCAYESRPFGNYPICYRISGKIFCQLTPQEDWYKVTLKTNPDAADFYRSTYPGVVVRGYHCPATQQPYWNTVELTEVSEELIFQMINEAYDEVVKHLTKKEQKQIPEKSHYTFVKTNGKNKDFVCMCTKLDQNLDDLVGGNKQRSQYEQYNTLEKIQDVIVIYKDCVPVGAGAYRFYDDETVEIKRIYVDKPYRGIGLSKELVLRLEADARIKGFRYGILETGKVLETAIHLYQRIGYKVIPNYGPYIEMPDSVCMQKKL